MTTPTSHIYFRTTSQIFNSDTWRFIGNMSGYQLLCPKVGTFEDSGACVVNDRSLNLKTAGVRVSQPGIRIRLRARAALRSDVVATLDRHRRSAWSGMRLGAIRAVEGAARTDTSDASLECTYFRTQKSPSTGFLPHLQSSSTHGTNYDE